MICEYNQQICIITSFSCFYLRVEVTCQVCIFHQHLYWELHEQLLSRPHHLVDLHQVFSEDENETDQVDGQQKSTQYNHYSPRPLDLTCKELVYHILANKRQDQYLSTFIEQTFDEIFSSPIIGTTFAGNNCIGRIPIIEFMFVVLSHIL